MWSSLILLISAFVISGGLYTLIYALYNPYGVEYFIWMWVPIVGTPIIYCVLFALFLGIFTFIGLFVKIDTNKKKPNKFMQYVVSGVTHQLHFFGRARIKMTGKDKLPKNGPVLFIYNHTSNFDPMLLMDKMYKYNLICVTKPSNKKIPCAGPAIHMAGYISIDRENDFNAAKDIALAIKFVKERKCSIAIAPEGTRNKTDDLLLPFHGGSFKIATKTQIPIVEVGIRNTINIHKNFPLKKTIVNMDILNVYYYDNYKDLNTVEIADMCREDFMKYLQK